MSIKRRFEHQYQNIIYFFRNISLPGWMESGTFRATMMILVFAVGVCYVNKISAMATGGYQMRDLENKVAILETDIQKIQVDIAANSALTNVKSRLSEVKMISAFSVSYLSVQSPEMAKR